MEFDEKRLLEESAIKEREILRAAKAEAEAEAEERRMKNEC